MVLGKRVRLSVGVAKAPKCPTAAANQPANTLAHVFSIYHFLALNFEIYLGNVVLLSNAKHIEPANAPKPV